MKIYLSFTFDLNLHRLGEIKTKVKGDNVDGTVAKEYLSRNEMENVI